MGGFGAVVDGWVTTITTALDDKTVKGNPFDHRLVRVLLPEYLDEIQEAEGRRAELDATIKGATGSTDDDADDDADIEDALSSNEISALKKELTAAKKRAKALEQQFVTKLAEARSLLPSDDVQTLVLGVARADLTDHLDTYVSNHRQLVTSALENWWDKYAFTMEALEDQAHTARAALTSFEKALGYV